MVYRAFCIPGVDNVAAIDPTYGMYQVCADVNDVEYRKVLLDETISSVPINYWRQQTITPNWFFFARPIIQPVITWIVGKWKIAGYFSGIGDYRRGLFRFSDAPSFLADLDKYPNLIVFQTFSKAWGCAAIRLGMAFASKEIISISVRLNIRIM